MRRAVARTAALVAAGVVAAAPAPAGGAGAGDSARLDARRAYVAFIDGIRTAPARTCRRRLTERARRQYDAAGITPSCRAARAVVDREPFVLRITRVRGRRALATFAPLRAAVFCDQDEGEAVLARDDVMTKVNGAWRIDRFGFGATSCVPRKWFG